jgi:formylglycine-generating enzyme required for sulfatase activity
VFHEVRTRVARETSGQTPWTHDGLVGDRVIFVPAQAPGVVVAPSAPPTRLSEAAEAWASVKDSTDVRDLEAYRRQYGQLNLFYDRQAERRIDELKKQVAVAAPPPAAKPTPVVEPAVGLFSASRAPLPLKAVEERALKPKDSFKECGTCPEMVVVPAGSFAMGSPASEEGRLDTEGPQRQVTIARPFAVGKFEVTFAEWDACVSAGGCAGNKTPSDQGWGRGKRPVINVSWDDAKEYTAWLSRTTGKTYRLLTEAEWEYAARGVTSASTPSKRYWWGDQASHEYANYGNDQCCAGHKEGRDQWENTAPVGQFPANPFGLHDMHGNAWEWVEDCWHDSYQGAPMDSSAWTTSCMESGRRVLRGGSWFDFPQFLRAAVRGFNLADYRYYRGGFRIGRTLTP